MISNQSRKSRKAASTRTRIEQVKLLPIDDISPSPENDLLYSPVKDDDPATQALVHSIRVHGILEPLVITEDGYILSGHRRHRAALLAGLQEIPVRVEKIHRTADSNAFLVKLREHNRQRDKSFAEQAREEILTVDPEEAHRIITEHRKKSSQVDVSTISLGKRKIRSEFRAEKEEFRQAIISLVWSYQDYWPLTDRQIHYYLLNDPPMENTRTGKRYQNNLSSYANLVSKMLNRMRLNGDIPFQAIADETRPVETWQVFNGPRLFLQDQMGNLFKGYYRDLMASQPNHIELLAEKNTVYPIVRNVASDYSMPVTSGRGFASLDPRHKMAQRFEKSGKDKLILIVCSDFDPSGERIAESFARSMRDDFGVENIVPVKAALTWSQVHEYQLPEGLPTKEDDSNRKWFESKYGRDQKCHELESLRPEILAKLIKEAIDSVIDIDAFNQEVDAEKEDAADLETLRRKVVATIQQ